MIRFSADTIRQRPPAPAPAPAASRNIPRRDLEARMAAMWRDGAPAAVIAAELGISKKYVYTLRVRLELPSRYARKG